MNHVKKIGIFLDMHPHGGGAFQYSMSILDAANALPRDRYEPVVCYTKQAWKPLLETFSGQKIFLNTSNFAKWTLYIWRKLGLPITTWRKFAPGHHSTTKKLLALSCNLWVFPSQDAMAYMLPVPALVSVHDLMHRYEADFPEVAGYRMRELHYRAICRYAAGILVDSEVGRSQLVESYDIDANIVHKLPYVAPPYMLSTTKADVGQRHKLPSKYFFYPAQFWKHKNHTTLLYALAILREQNPDVQLVLVGAQKNGYTHTVKLIKSLKLEAHVHILGYVSNEELAALYNHARALIMPSRFGPTNIPPLEAMAVGCPMAVSDIYAMPEQAGNAALYFNPRSEQELAAVMQRLWTDDELCANLSQIALHRAAQYTQAQFNQGLINAINATFSEQQARLYGSIWSHI